MASLPGRCLVLGVACVGPGWSVATMWRFLLLIPRSGSRLVWRLSRRGPWSCRWMSSSVMARSTFVLNRILMRGPCSLQVEDLENMPAGSPYIIAPNRVSYLDAFAVAAALDYSVLRRTYWAEHYVRVEQRDERVDVTVARCGEEGVDDLSLGGEVGLLALRVARAHHVQAHPPARSGPALTWLSNRPSATGPGRSSSRTG